MPTVHCRSGKAVVVLNPDATTTTEAFLAELAEALVSTSLVTKDETASLRIALETPDKSWVPLGDTLANVGNNSVIGWSLDDNFGYEPYPSYD